MELYVRFVHAFTTPAEVRDFWFGMAKHEAGHCGALALVERIIKTDPKPVVDKPVWLDEATVTRLRALLQAYLREVKRGISLERAFEMAVDIEASELEDLVVDMLSVVRAPKWRERALQMLIHDLGDLSYMVERYTNNADLLKRADALIEQRRGGLVKGSASARRLRTEA